MSRRRHQIAQKRLVFLGCEGVGEESYGALLNRIAREHNMSLAVRVYLVNPGAGDPEALVRGAVRRLEEDERKGTTYYHKALLLDLDVCERHPEICANARLLAARNGVQLIWQRWKHEAFLLRHLDGCHRRQPPAQESVAQLRAEWPDYAKPLTAAKLAQRIDRAAIRRACSVEGELEAFLQAANWIHG